MTQSPEETIRQSLDSNERLLWCGQPQKGIRLRTHDFFLIPFSLFWAGFAFVWEAVAIFGVAQSSAPIAIRFLFPIFGIPFVIVGLYLLIGRFFVDAYVRERTIYGVTNERVIIIAGLFSLETKSLQLRTLTDVTLTEKNNGLGTIGFGLGTLVSGGYIGNGMMTSTRRLSPPSFYYIQDAKEVYNIIRGAQKSA